MKAIVLTILTLFIIVDNPTTVQIKINYNRTEDNQVWTKRTDQITVKKKGRTIQEIPTDKTGLVEIKKDSINKYGKLDIFMTSSGMQELYLLSVDKKTSNKLEINLPRQYELKEKFAVCPKCHKSDKVMKAIYGDNQSLLRVVKKGDTTYTNKIGKDYFMGTCKAHELNPKWYCDRDDIQF